MAHWDEDRDRQRVEMMRACGELSIDRKDLIDKYEETGDPVYWAQFVDEIRRARRNETPARP